MRRVAVAVLCVATLLAMPALADSKEKFSDLSFTVLKDENGKPVRNASVVLHEVDKDGHQAHGGIQLKTNPEGKTEYSGVPFGKVRVQVIAPGFQTYGEDFNIDQPKHDFTIKLKRPQKQYSIYDK
jgi:hypothetical protein